MKTGALAAVYNLLAPLYRIFLDMSLGGLRREQAAALPYVKGERVLEVGCGTGYLLSRMADGTREVTGLDVSSGMLRQAAKRLARDGGKASLIRGSYYSLPFEAGCFDCVVATFTLTHAPALEPVLEEVARVLAPQGRLVIVDVGVSLKPSVWAGLMERIWRILGDYPRDETPGLERTGFKVLHRRELSKWGTTHLLVAERTRRPA